MLAAALALLAAAPLGSYVAKSDEIPGYQRDTRTVYKTAKAYAKGDADHLAELKRNGFSGAIDQHFKGADGNEARSGVLRFGSVAGVDAEKKRILARFSVIAHNGTRTRIRVPGGGKGFAVTTSRSGNYANAVIPYGTCLLTIGDFIQDDTDVARMKAPLTAGVKAILARTSACG